MQDAFIARIGIKKVRHLEKFNICLSDVERIHLILTGKNGSGKTSLLEAMRGVILNQQLCEMESIMEPISGKFIYSITHPAATYIPTEGENIKGYKNNNFFSAPIIEIEYVSEEFIPCFFTFSYISAKRSDFEIPNAIEKVKISNKDNIMENMNIDFLKYMLSLDYQLYGAKNDGNEILEVNIKNWFTNFQNALQRIYKCDDLKLTRDTKNFSFLIEMPGREPFALHQMADGYTALLEIYMELIMRFETGNGIVDYAHPAIVLIDEIETHLHVELQKEVLPFLTEMFPNVQFIVTTHSPFVISSISNAVVFDLEKRERLENPGIYSYEAIVEGYLDVGQYSNEMKNTFKRYRELYNKERNEDETREFQKLISALELVPPASKELFLAFRTMEDKRKAR